MAPFFDHGGIAQQVDQLAFNQRVVGSIPTSPTKRIKEGGGVAKTPDWNLIKKEYLDNHDTIQLKDLATKHGVKPATLRSRKNREKWDDELPGIATRNATQQKNVATQKKIKAKKNKPVLPEEHLTKEHLAATDLTEKQQLFCLYYLKYFNATKAYRKAYGCDYMTANANGSRLLVNASVQKQIEALKQQRMQGIFLDGKDILQKYIDIAFADITDFAEFGTKEVWDGESTDEVDYVRMKNHDEVDGTIITEVKKGRDGISIKLADRMKALEKLDLYYDLLPDKWKRQLEEEKLKVAKMRVPQTGLTNNLNITVELIGDEE